MRDIKNKQYITTSEFAEILNVSRVTIFNRIKNGDIKAEKICRNYAIPTNQLSGIFYNTISEKIKMEIDEGVHKVLREYGEVIKKLGKEERYGSN